MGRLLVAAGLLWLTAFDSGRAAAAGSSPTPTPRPTGRQTASTIFKFYIPFVANNVMYFDGPPVAFGYGWGVYNWRNYWPAALTPYTPTSFNWVKITENPSPSHLCGANRLPYHVLLRLNKADANATPQQVADDTWTWAHDLETAPGVSRCVDAFEIGNEPNLSMNGGYSGPVNPEQYADQLCAAYTAVKNTDPGFIVVSAGLAPTAGLLDETLALNDIVYLRRMLDRIKATHNGDAGACFDVLGYHNYGFRTGHATDPASPACVERSCFRGVEAILSILRFEYGVTKRIWSTEIGWMRDFVAGGCGAAPWAGAFNGFQLSHQGQADELVGAYQYARANWQWMGAMFVFNLDFDQRPQSLCADEQGWFAVKGYPAEGALEAMPKP